MSNEPLTLEETFGEENLTKVTPESARLGALDALQGNLFMNHKKGKHNIFSWTTYLASKGTYSLVNIDGNVITFKEEHLTSKTAFANHIYARARIDIGEMSKDRWQRIKELILLCEERPTITDMDNENERLKVWLRHYVENNDPVH